jgi:hypothetical protein
MLFNRRDVEATQRAHSFQVADSLSKVLEAHLTWKRLGTFLYCCCSQDFFRFMAPV